jgi:hypothetical protein
MGKESSLHDYVENDNGIRNGDWSNAFCTEMGVQRMYHNSFNNYEVVECIRPTGYSVLELAKVEKAFETNTKIHYNLYSEYTREQILQDQFNGLMAAVDVLCEIEGIEDATEYKQLFEYQS